MARAVKLSESARIFRSKNAGPFRTTIDIFYSDSDKYYQIKQSGKLTIPLVAEVFNIPKENVEGIFFLDQVCGIKVTLVKPTRMASGELRCTDMLGAQQYIPLKDLAIEIEE
ncbi:MAG: DUF4387 family protein [Candidatus Hodarchaeota archaeon]